MALKQIEQEDESDRKVIEISKELDEVFSRLRDRIKEATWGVDSETSYYKLSKILARKINAAKII